MSALEALIPAPGLHEIDWIDLAAPPQTIWTAIREGDLGRSPIVRALFGLRTLFSRDRESVALRLDNLVSTRERPGFQILSEDPPREIVVGAIGKVWKADIPFVHVESFADFARFAQPDYVRIAWAFRLEPRGDGGTRLSVEVRVDATDDEAWKKFRVYFLAIGPASRFIRRSLLAALGREFGTLDGLEHVRPLPGDELIADASDQMTHFLDVAATPDAIWPWLVQMGCRRGGFYAVDLLDNGNVPSAREVHPEWQDLRVGDTILARPDGKGEFEILRIDEGRALVLGGLVCGETGTNLPFHAPRPDRFWQSTWAFVLEPLDEKTTRVNVRVRAAFEPPAALRIAVIKGIHHLMEGSQLRHLAARVEGRFPRDTTREIASGAAGAAVMLAAWMTPFLRGARNHWGLSERDAARAYPGDEIVANPRWMWTHAVEIDAPAAEVWPWVAQVGADRGGFYSYQWLENVAGCDLQNAERVHPDWAVREGGTLSLHPRVPPLAIAALVPGEYFVAYGRPDESAKQAGKPWAAATWLFQVEPLGERKCRFVSRYRVATSDDLAARISFGPSFMEPIGFAMDRRMLLGVKERAERSLR